MRVCADAAVPGYYEDERVRIAMSIGWGALDGKKRYVFEGMSPFWDDDAPDFFWIQNEYVEREKRRSYSYADLFNAFSSALTPVVIAVLAKQELDGSLMIESVATPTTLLAGRLLKAWEYQYGVAPKTTGPGYFLDGVPLNSMYEAVFLFPSELLHLPVSFRFRELGYPWRATVTTVPADESGLQARIRFLEQEISRLKSLVGNRSWLLDEL